MSKIILTNKTTDAYCEACNEAVDKVIRLFERFFCEKCLQNTQDELHTENSYRCFGFDPYGPNKCWCRCNDCININAAGCFKHCYNAVKDIG